MKNSFWTIIDKTIIILNKMESLLSLIIIFTGTSAYVTEDQFWIKISFVFIIMIGLVTVLLLSVFMYRKVNDLSFVRNYFNSNEWENLKHSIDYKLVSLAGDNRKPEIRKTEYIKNAVLNILEIRKNMSYYYAEKLVKSLINDENLKDFRS